MCLINYLIKSTLQLRQDNKFLHKRSCVMGNFYYLFFLRLRILQTNFNLPILNYVPAYVNRSQWQGDGREVCRRITENRYRQPWPNVKGLGSSQQVVHWNKVRWLELQWPCDNGRFGIDNHQRTFRQKNQVLGHKKLRQCQRNCTAGKSHIAWLIERFKLENSSWIKSTQTRLSFQMAIT